MPGRLELNGVRAQHGTTQKACVVNAAPVTTVTVNDVPLTTFVHDDLTASTQLSIPMAGLPFEPSQKVVGSWDEDRSSAEHIDSAILLSCALSSALHAPYHQHCDELFLLCALCALFVKKH